MPLIPAKEFLERFKARKPLPTPTESERDRYFDALGEIVEQHPIVPRRVRGCGNPD